MLRWSSKDSRSKDLPRRDAKSQRARRGGVDRALPTTAMTHCLRADPTVRRATDWGVCRTVRSSDRITVQGTISRRGTRAAHDRAAQQLSRPSRVRLQPQETDCPRAPSSTHHVQRDVKSPLGRRDSSSGRAPRQTAPGRVESRTRCASAAATSLKFVRQAGHKASTAP